jgi:GntR family transcriptional regulator/MocR family aminotransferase
MRCPPELPATRLAAALRDVGVVIEPGAAFFAQSGAGEGYYRIAYSSITSDRIPEGIARIARASRAMAPRA